MMTIIRSFFSFLIICATTRFVKAWEPFSLAHPSIWKGDYQKKEDSEISVQHVTTDRRRIFTTIAAFTAFPHVACADETKSCKTPKKLLDARSQLDLAVQASSVQAWSDAADIINDKILDEKTLNSFFDSCKQTDDNKDQLRIDALEAIKKVKVDLSQKSLTTEDAMEVMKYGTEARIAIDSYFGL